MYVDSYLTEDGVLRADEAPAEGVLPAVGIGHWQAHMEDLAIVLHIRVVAIRLVGARKVVRDVRPDGRGVAGQGEGAQGCAFRRSTRLHLRFRLFWHFHLGRRRRLFTYRGMFSFLKNLKAKD